MLRAALFATSGKLKTIQMSITGQTDDQTVVYPYNGYYTAIKKDKLPICNNMDETQNN